MHCTTILVAATFCTFVSGQEYAGSAQCGCLEVPATSSRQKDKFCRPHLTIPSERHKHRNCVCRPGMLRNSWGECITKQECTSCKCFRDRDFNVCGRECPVVCNEPISRSCSKSCAFGCDCLPGFVRNSRMRGRCVKATKCALTCPPFSRFQFCRSTCAPKCGRHPLRTCVTRCQRGDCVCNEGYAEVEHNGETICVPQDQCSRYLQLAAPVTPGGNGSLGGGVMPGGSVFVPGTPPVSVRPGVVTGGAAGTPVPTPVPGINGNIGGRVSSGGSVSFPITPSIPVQPGVVTGGAVGTPVPTPVPGSASINGNLGGGVSSGGSASFPITPSIPVQPGVVTGSAAGPSMPGSVGTGSASPIPSVPTVGTGGVVTVVGGNQSGPFGTGSVLPVPGTNGAVSGGTYPQGGVNVRPSGPFGTGGVVPVPGTNGAVSGGTYPQGGVTVGPSGPFGTGGVVPVPGANGGVSGGAYPQGGAPARLPGSIDAHGRPSIGSNGFGSAGGGIFTGSTGRNGSTESGEDSGVAAAGIPIYQGGSPPVGAPAVTGTTISNGISSLGGVGSQPGHVPPKITILPPYVTKPAQVSGVGTGGSYYPTPGSPLLHQPGSSTPSIHSAGSAIGPSGMPTGLAPTPVQLTPGSVSVTSGAATPGTNVASSGTTVVPSGVSFPAGIPSVGVVPGGNGFISNQGNVPGISGTNMASISPSTVAGNVPSSAGVNAASGPLTVTVSPGAAGSGIVITNSSPSNTYPSGTATVVVPGSMSSAGGGSTTGISTGTNSATATPSYVTVSDGGTIHVGVIGGRGGLNTGPATSAGAAAPSNIFITGADSTGATFVPQSSGTVGAAGGGKFIIQSIGTPGGSIVNLSGVTTAPGSSGGVTATTPGISGSSLRGGFSAVPQVMAGMHASGGISNGRVE
uniref:Putative bitil peptide n=1 Tax=Rhipicephalus pulchellus TaxID=72859 RepID=L7LQ98_RHIPC